MFLFFGCKGEAADAMRISYIPLDLRTYAAITPETIGEAAYASFSLRRDSEDARLIAGIVERSSDGHFDRQAVRILIDIGARERLWIDSKGGLFDGRTSRRIDPEDVTTLKAILHRRAPVPVR
jgi:hypothetical protein